MPGDYGLQVPPRIREVIRMLETRGWILIRQGKGDHRIFARGEQREAIDGSDNYEMPKGRWEKLKKKYGLGD